MRWGDGNVDANFGVRSVRSSGRRGLGIRGERNVEGHLVEVARAYSGGFDFQCGGG